MPFIKAWAVRIRAFRRSIRASAWSRIQYRYNLLSSSEYEYGEAQKQLVPGIYNHGLKVLTNGYGGSYHPAWLLGRNPTGTLDHLRFVQR